MKTDIDRFVFGGSGITPPATEDAPLSDMWILSLPAFHWFKVDQQTAPRHAHACGLVGKRQMLVVGGITGYYEERKPEPWAKSLGIFDMTDLRWTDGYDADSPEYETPGIVQQWYIDG